MKKILHCYGWSISCWMASRLSARHKVVGSTPPNTKCVRKCVTLLGKGVTWGGGVVEVAFSYNSFGAKRTSFLFDYPCWLSGTLTSPAGGQLAGILVSIPIVFMVMGYKPGLIACSVEL